MLLTTVASVREKFSFDDIEDVNNAVIAALNSATEHLSASLRTLFPTTAHVDDYYINSLSHKGANKEIGYQLKLTQGFVRASPAILVEYADSYVIMTAGTEQVDITAYCNVDTEKGLVRIMDYDVADGYVRVTYSGGFGASSSDTNQYASDEVPEWIKEAARSQASIALDANSAFKEENSSGVSLKDLRSAVSAIVDLHVRYAPGAFKPFNS